MSMLEELKKLRTIYSVSDEVQIGDELKVKLKVISSEEETDAHAGSLSFEQGLAYFYAVKRETILRAIIGLNGVDLPEIIEDFNEKGESEKLLRYLWLKKNIVKGWSQLIIDQIWNAYTKLTEKVESKVKKGIETENSEKKTDVQ